MTERKLNTMAMKWWYIGLRAMKDKYPEKSYCKWISASEHQKYAMKAIVRHAVKTLNGKKP